MLSYYLPIFIVDSGRPLPTYMISTNATALTEDRSDITPLCAATYTQSMSYSTNKMAIQLNQAISQGLCPDASDLVVAATSVNMVFRDSEV